jgi:hypothetical protein
MAARIGGRKDSWTLEKDGKDAIVVGQRRKANEKGGMKG